jgi:antagonist of KipI
MIEVITPAMHTIVVDSGRFGYRDIGVPTSAALDTFAYKCLNYLTGNDKNAAVLEVVGRNLTLCFHAEITCAITGAKVKAFLDDDEIREWTTFRAKEGSTLRIREIREGFRYYVGFSGKMNVDKKMGSYTTNLECGFGGYKGKSLSAKDRIAIENAGVSEIRVIPERHIPGMSPPHKLRIVAGPESAFFTDDSLKRMVEKKSQTVYTVSGASNRTGIRIEGESLLFRENADKSIISEGVMPGTVQIPGDGKPIIALHERTIGGYARIGMIIKADQDRLAHLKPSDDVIFEMIGMSEAEALWKRKQEDMGKLTNY